METNTSPNYTREFKALKQSMFHKQGLFEKTYIKLMATSFGKFVVSTSLTLQTSFSTFFSKFRSGFSVYFRKVFGEVMDTFQPIFDSIKGIGGFVLNMIIKPMGKFFLTIISKISKIPIFSVPLKVLKSIGNAVWSSISTIFSFVGTMFGKAGNWLLKLPFRFIKGIFKFVGKVVWFTFETAFLFLRKTISWTVDKVKEIGKKIGTFLTGALDLIGTILTGPGFLVGEGLKLIPGGAFIAPIISTVINTVLLGGAILGGASFVGKALFSTGKGVLGHIFNGLGEILGNIWEKITKFFKGAWKNFSKAYPNAAKPIQKMLDWLGGIFEKISPVWNEIMANTPKLFSDVFDILSAVFKTSIYETMSIIWEFVKSKGKIVRNAVLAGGAAIAGVTAIIATGGTATPFVLGLAATLGVAGTAVLTAHELKKEILGLHSQETVSNMSTQILEDATLHFKKTTDAIKEIKTTPFPTFGDNISIGGSGGGGSIPSTGAGTSTGLNIPSNMLSNINRWDPLIQKYSQAYGVPANLIKGVMAQESGGDPEAKGPSRDFGLMQITEKTAHGLGIDKTDAWKKDPEINLEAGVRLLRDNLRIFKGDAAKAVGAYNAGPQAIKEGRLPQVHIKRVLTYAGMLDKSTVAFTEDTKKLKEENKVESPFAKILSSLGSAFSSITSSLANLTSEDLYSLGKSSRSAEISKAEREHALERATGEGATQKRANNQAVSSLQPTATTAQTSHIQNTSDWVNTRGIILMGS